MIAVYPACGRSTELRQAQRLRKFTPHARIDHTSPLVYPACGFTPHARIDLRGSEHYHTEWFTPHAGSTLFPSKQSFRRLFTPQRGSTNHTWDISPVRHVYFRMRGSTSSPEEDASGSCLPRMRGIDHNRAGQDFDSVGLPRMRGDRPSLFYHSSSSSSFTPHARGSTPSAPQR